MYPLLLDFTIATAKGWFGDREYVEVPLTRDCEEGICHRRILPGTREGLRAGQRNDQRAISFKF